MDAGGHLGMWRIYMPRGKKALRSGGETFNFYDRDEVIFKSSCPDLFIVAVSQW